MSSHQGCERGPCLSAWWNVLPLFFANYALPRRDTARRVLGAAGSANERVHITVALNRSAVGSLWRRSAAQLSNCECWICGSDCLTLRYMVMAYRSTPSK